MKNGKFLILIGAFVGLSLIPSTHGHAVPTKMELVDHDPFGVWRSKPKDFEQMVARGAKIVYMPEEQTFFTYWVPPNYRSGRIVVSVHGTGGNPYIAMRDEIPSAEKYDYLPVAYIGFSRGAAVSYEVAYLDATSEKIFDLFISHSGGVPLDLRVEALNPNSKPDPFFSKLVNGELGNDAFKGTKFFLYSGDKDESWGLTMSRQLEHAKQLIEANGGEVLEWVRDPNGTHAGFLKNPAIREKALRYFIELTENKLDHAEGNQGE